MRVAVFSTKPYDESFLAAANDSHDLSFLEPHLAVETTVLAAGHDAVCAFVNDDLSAPVIDRLAALGVRLLALRSAGFNHVDLDAAARHGMVVARVPAYSPHAVAEHTVALLLALNRKVHRAFNRVREGNFSLDGLMGFDLAGFHCKVDFRRRDDGGQCAEFLPDVHPNGNCRQAHLQTFDVVRSQDSAV